MRKSLSPTSPADTRHVVEASGFAFFLGMLLSFSTMEALGKLVSQTYPIVQTVWARYTFHAVIGLTVLVLIRLAGRDHGIRRSRRLGTQILRSLALFGMTFFYFQSLARLPIVDATAIIFTAPLIMTALSRIVLGERVDWRVWCAVLVGFVGVLIVIQPLSLAAALTGDTNVVPPETIIGFATGGVAAVMFALYMTWSRVVSVVDSPETGLLYSAIAGVIATNVMVPFQWQTPDATGWVMLVTLGSLGGLGQYLSGFAFARVPANSLGPLTYIQLLFATVYGIILFDTIPGIHTLVGGVLIMLAGIYTYRRRGTAIRPSVQAARAPR